MSKKINNQTTQSLRQFIKYPGNKTKLMPVLRQYLPDPLECDGIVDVFTGSGSLLMNTNYKRYILAGANKDLIWLFDLARRYPENLVINTRYFYQNFRGKEGFELIRRQFPTMKKGLAQSAAFIYLIYHCFNGVVRYNQKGEFNSPCGIGERQPYLPEREIYAFRIITGTYVSADISETLINMMFCGLVLRARGNFMQLFRNPIL